MPVQQTHIDADLIGGVLGNISRIDGVLVLDLGVNPFSLYKPVRGDWPASSDGKYGLDLLNNWAYLRPRGDYNLHPDEPFDLGHFRGYEHDKALAFPSIHCLLADFSEDDLFPSSSPSSNTSRVRVYRAADGFPSIITPEHLSLNDWHIGIRLLVNSTYYFRTFGLVSAFTTDGLNPWIETIMVETNPGDNDWHFADFPVNSFVGNVSFDIIIMNQEAASWDAINPFPTFYKLFEGVSGATYKSSGSFYINEWMELSDQSYHWNGLTEETIEIEIYCDASTLTEILSVTPSWLTVEVGHYIGEPAEWEALAPANWGNGTIVRITPDNPISTLRSHTMQFGVGAIVLATLELDQLAEQSLPTANVVTVGFSSSPSATASINLNSTSLSFHCWPNVDGISTLKVFKNSVELLEHRDTNLLLEQSTDIGYVITLGAPSTYNDEYEITIEYQI